MGFRVRRAISSRCCRHCPSGNSPADFAKLIDAEHVKWAKVVKASGAKVD